LHDIVFTILYMHNDEVDKLVISCALKVCSSYKNLPANNKIVIIYLLI